MGRLLRLFVIIACVASAAAWLADHPGRLLLDWQGYRIETSFAVLLLLAGLSYFTLRLPFWIYGRWRGAQGRLVRQRSGLEALTRGMTAIAAGNASDARSYAARAGRLLNGQPLALLMQAQAAELRGDEAAARGYFQAMLISPETEFLGLRGLLTQAMRQGDMGYAGRLVERAARLQPKSPWLIRNKFEIECATGAWPQASETLGRAVQTRLISKPERKRRQAILSYAQACQAAEQGSDMQALLAAQTAVKGAPDLVPATALAAQLLARTGKPDKASRLLEKSWAQAPHPDLAAAWSALVPQETPAQSVVRSRKLIAANPEHMESRLLGAELALAAGETARAVELLRPLLGTGGNRDASPRACLLMAQLTRAQGKGPQEIQRWLSRAPMANPDPVWQCKSCRQQAQAWHMQCPACGEFDVMLWRAPMPAPGSGPQPEPGLLAQTAAV